MERCFFGTDWTRFLSMLAAAALIITTMSSSAHAQTYDVCQTSMGEGALLEVRWDCGGTRAPGKSFDYMALQISAGDGRDFYIRRMQVPDSPYIRNSSNGYAWGTFVGQLEGYAGRYIKWTLVDDGSVRCWDVWRRVSYMVEIEPSLCE